MYRLVPCIPIFRGFFIKSAKRMCICDYVKNRIGTCKNVLLGLSGLLHWIVVKPSALEPLEKSKFDVPTTQMSIFVFFVSAGV